MFLCVYIYVYKGSTRLASNCFATCPHIIPHSSIRDECEEGEGGRIASIFPIVRRSFPCFVIFALPHMLNISLNDYLMSKSMFRAIVAAAGATLRRRRSFRAGGLLVLQRFLQLLHVLEQEVLTKYSVHVEPRRDRLFEAGMIRLVRPFDVHCHFEFVHVVESLKH